MDVVVLRKVKQSPLGHYASHEVQPFENSYSFFWQTDCIFYIYYRVVGHPLTSFSITIEMIPYFFMGNDTVLKERKYLLYISCCAWFFLFLWVSILGV